MQTTDAHAVTSFQPLAHRGFALDHPENTLSAFQKAADLGVLWMEIDVHCTVDGVVVIFHDCTLNRMAGMSGNISEKTWQELQEIDLPGGHKIPSLEEALIAFPNLYFNIDVKDEASATELPKVVARTGAVNRIRIASFSEQRRNTTLRTLEKLVPSQKVLSSGSEIAIAMFYVLAHTAPRLVPFMRKFLSPFSRPFTSIQVPLTYKLLGQKITVVTPRLLEVAHKNNISVQVWTVDCPQEMNRLRAMGVDGIVTNRSDVLMNVLSKTSTQAKPVGA